MHRNRITDDEGSGRNLNSRTTVEGERMIGARLNRAAACTNGDVRRANFKWLGSKFVCKLHAHRGAAEADVHDIAIGRIGWSRLACVYDFAHGRSGPCPNPVCIWPLGESRKAAEPQESKNKNVPLHVSLRQECIFSFGMSV